MGFLSFQCPLSSFFLKAINHYDGLWWKGKITMYYTQTPILVWKFHYANTCKCCNLLGSKGKVLCESWFAHHVHFLFLALAQYWTVKCLLDCYRLQWKLFGWFRPIKIVVWSCCYKQVHATQGDLEVRGKSSKKVSNFRSACFSGLK